MYNNNYYNEKSTTRSRVFGILQFTSKAINFTPCLLVNVRTAWSVVLGVLYFAISPLGTLGIHICT